MGNVINKLKQLSIFPKIIIVVCLIIALWLAYMYAGFKYYNYKWTKDRTEIENMVESTWHVDGMKLHNYTEKINHLVKTKDSCYWIYHVGSFNLKKLEIPNVKNAVNSSWDYLVHEDNTFYFFLYSMEHVESMPVGVIIYDMNGNQIYSGVADINDHNERMRFNLKQDTEIRAVAYYLIDEETIEKYEKDSGTKVNIDKTVLEKEFDIEFVELSGIMVPDEKK